jgi:hypothetical protein
LESIHPNDENIRRTSKVIPWPKVRGSTANFCWFSDDEFDLSIEYFGWHCHVSVSLEIEEGYYQEWDILDGLQMIVSGDIVGFYESPNFDRPMGILFLRSKYQLENEITSKYSTGRIRLASWDGTKDLDLDTENFSKIEFL